MAYEKRVCVLKQVKRGFSADGGTLSGAVYCERLNGTLTVTPKLLGIAPLREGRYALAIGLGDAFYCFPYGEERTFVVSDAPTVKGGFSALLCVFRTGVDAESVAYGTCGVGELSEEELLLRTSAAVKEKKKKIHAVPLPPTELPPNQPNTPLAPPPPVPAPLPEEETHPFRESLGVYDDEAIATSDYYGAAHADETPPACDQGQGEEEKAGNGGRGDEIVPPRLAKGSLTYYHEVRDKLNAAFEKYPRDERLLGTFPRSEWVNAGEGLLGIIYESGMPRYLCVASKAPFPGEEKGTLVPCTPFSDEDGFYIVFQDADTGEYVKVFEA